ncbi:MAG: phage integrase family protein [Oligoflexia bacterium]|nr:phage integrase family protein [Oligoflexia bacterium]
MNNKLNLKDYNKLVMDIASTLHSFKRESTGEPLNFVFHIKGEPITYRQVQHHYNKALKGAGLYPEFSATHILRKAMANIVKQHMGLEAAQAVGG